MCLRVPRANAWVKDPPYELTLRGEGVPPLFPSSYEGKEPEQDALATVEPSPKPLALRLSPGENGVRCTPYSAYSNNAIS